MKIIALDKTHVDYVQRVYASRRGLTSSVGIRVKERRCFIVVKIGDGPPNIFGTDYPLPVDLASLPSHVPIIVGDHVLNHPKSDLVQVLADENFFHDALDEWEGKRRQWRQKGARPDYTRTDINRKVEK